MKRVGQSFRVIAASKGGWGGIIGVNNKLPWNLSEDMQHFREKTRFFYFRIFFC